MAVVNSACAPHHAHPARRHHDRSIVNRPVEQVRSRPDATPGAQQAILDVTGKPRGTYDYVVEFTNALGATAAAPCR